MINSAKIKNLHDVCSILDDVAHRKTWKIGIQNTIMKADIVLSVINNIRTIIGEKYNLDLSEKENVDLVDEIAQEYCRCHISYEKRMSEKKADDAELRAKIKQKERAQQKMSRQASKPKAKKEFYF